MLPSQQVLEQIARKVKHIPNRRKESKRRVHFGLFLLGYKSGLRVNEAVSFDLSSKTKRGLYRIEKSKGQKERYVYVSKKVISELKKQNWKPNQTNRFTFYHFLRKVKRELNLPTNIELTPHTLRRAFTTYHAEAGLPLPLLQKLLGHSSIRTTALYWQNIHGDNDPANILAGKKWLETKKPPKSPPKIEEKFPIQPPKNFKPVITKEKPVIIAEKPSNSLLNNREGNNFAITNYQSKPAIRQISPQTPEKFSLNTSEQFPVITNREQPTVKEQILKAKIKQLETDLSVVKTFNKGLQEQLSQFQTKNSNLTNQLVKSEQEKKALAVKLANSEKLIQTEKQRADYYEQQLKTIAKTLYKKIETKIIQPLPWKTRK